jgi:hypothetical protein
MRSISLAHWYYHACFLWFPHVPCSRDILSRGNLSHLRDQWVATFPNIKSILQLNSSELPYLCRDNSLSLMPLKRTTTSKHITDLDFWLKNIALCGKPSRAEWVAMYRYPPKCLSWMGTAQRITLLASHLRQCPEELSGSEREQNTSQDLCANALAAFQ